MRGAWSLTVIAARDGGRAIACLAAPGAAVSSVPICARRLVPAPANSSSATSRRPGRMLVHKSSGAPACPAVPRHENIIGVMSPPLSLLAVGGHVFSRRALATTTHRCKSSALYARVSLHGAAFLCSNPNERASTQTTSRAATPTLFAANNPDDRPRRYRE